MIHHSLLFGCNFAATIRLVFALTLTHDWKDATTHHCDQFCFQNHLQMPQPRWGLFLTTRHSRLSARIAVIHWLWRQLVMGTRVEIIPLGIRHLSARVFLHTWAGCLWGASATSVRVLKKSIVIGARQKWTRPASALSPDISVRASLLREVFRDS